MTTSIIKLKRFLAIRPNSLMPSIACSGVVSNMSIVKHALATGARLRHTLIHGNKRRARELTR